MATPREQLANVLRQARLDAGYESHGALARRLNVSRPVVSKAENPGSPVPSDAVLAAIAGATGAGLDELARLAHLARSGPPGWFAGWSEDIEARASVIRWFEPSLVPGLIQTEAYARAVLSWKPESARTEANLAGRLGRQPVLDRAELRVVVLETVLYREVGDAATMSGQIAHLLEAGGRRSRCRSSRTPRPWPGRWAARSRSRRRARRTWPRIRNRSSRGPCTPILSWSRGPSAFSTGCAPRRYRGRRRRMH